MPEPTDALQWAKAINAVLKEATWPPGDRNFMISIMNQAARGHISIKQIFFIKKKISKRLPGFLEEFIETDYNLIIPTPGKKKAPNNVVHEGHVPAAGRRRDAELIDRERERYNREMIDIDKKVPIINDPELIEEIMNPMDQLVQE